MKATVAMAVQVAQEHGWGGLKWYLSELIGVSDDALHVHAGMLLLLIAATLWRRAPWHWLPWATVVLLESANEAVDLLSQSTGEATWAAAAHDAWMTLIWPTAILLLFGRLVRRYPGTVEAENLPESFE